MVSRDYTQEVGLPSGEKRVPKSVAVIVLLVLAIGSWFTVKTFVATTPHAKAAPAAEVVRN
jgi:hypothetical protein